MASVGGSGRPSCARPWLNLSKCNSVVISISSANAAADSTPTDTSCQRRLCQTRTKKYAPAP